MIATSVNNLAELLLARDDAAGAEALFSESLEMRRALYGERHPAVGIAWNNLAAVQQRLGRVDDAVRSYGEARSVLLVTLAPDHPNMGAIDGNLGRLHHDTGDHETALGHLRAALQVRRRAYDGNHPLVLSHLSDLGRCLTELARYEEAEAALMESFAGLEPQREQQARLFGAVLIRLARLYRATGREDDAARYEAMRPPSP